MDGLERCRICSKQPRAKSGANTWTIECHGYKVTRSGMNLSRAVWMWNAEQNQLNEYAKNNKGAELR